MYSLISSLVVMRDREAGVLMGTFAHASLFKYGQIMHQMGLRVVTCYAPVVLNLSVPKMIIPS